MSFYSFASALDINICREYSGATFFNGYEPFSSNICGYANSHQKSDKDMQQWQQRHTRKTSNVQSFLIGGG
jgi:hypothetical protein